MSTKGFVFLLGAVVLSIVLAGLLAERLIDPGLQRTLFVAAIAGVVAMTAGRFAERRGWVKGSLRLGDLKNEIGRRKPADPQQNTTNSTGESR